MLVLVDLPLGLPSVEDLGSGGIVGVLGLQVPDVLLKLANHLLMISPFRGRTGALHLVLLDLGLGAFSLCPDIHQELACAVRDLSSR